jgi:D-Tyr-tRNAtyr deacylase
MRNDYKIRPRPDFKVGGAAVKGKKPAFKKGGSAKKADMLTAKMSKDKKGRAVAKGKR